MKDSIKFNMCMAVLWTITISLFLIDGRSIPAVIPLCIADIYFLAKVFCLKMRDRK